MGVIFLWQFIGLNFSALVFENILAFFAIFILKLCFQENLGNIMAVPSLPSET